ncbi:DME family drug/metabolite transporter [Labedella gwakjiensis]|uniref:DME family drug/metabolite transporter n=1 Tax=Labedella gwakjiensis TaxID=390269 RepID=A0A2P8GZE0_9MICO|nr:EamA family transporter [Labedella gwakjiensis]PSL39339.1 DME family drug/metabolite transporter [Labedella gwakjiensis]RUQ86244.1 EamA family transporter [Labedella gwakjiensis]
MPVLFVLLAAVCFGTTGTALALGPGDASPLGAGAVRIVIGGGILAAVVLVRRPRGPLPAGIAGDSPARRIPSTALVAIGSLGIVAYQPAFFLGTTRVGVAVGTVVALGSAPIFTGAFEWLVTRRFPGLVWAGATAIATGGVVLLSGGTDGAIAPDPVGLAGSLAAGASYGVYALVAKILIARGAESAWTMGTLFGAAAVLSIPLALSTDLRWLVSLEGLAVALWLGVVTTAVAYLLFGRGLVGLSAATASTVTLAEPVTATLLGLVVLGERLSPSAVGGVCVIAVAIVVLVVPWTRLVRSRRAVGGVV